MDEEVIAAVVGGDEAEALLGAEPLDRAGGPLRLRHREPKSFFWKPGEDSHHGRSSARGVKVRRDSNSLTSRGSLFAFRNLPSGARARPSPGRARVE